MNEETRKQLELLKWFPAWQIIQAELSSMLKEVEDEIFIERQREIKYSYEDILKRERNILKMFVELPDTMIDEIKNWIIEEKE